RRNGMEALMALKSRPQPPTAGVCFNDISAFGVMLGLNRLGMRIGHEFAVTGHDDITEAGLWMTGPTTVAVPTEEIGRQAARVLLERIDDPARPAQTVILEPKLMLRESSGGCAAA